MFACCISLAVLLTLTEIVWTTEGAYRFTQEPLKKLYFTTGDDAVFKWVYSVDNKTAELQFVIFNAGATALIYEDSSGKFKFSSAIPQAYVGRVAGEKPATFVIKNITSADSGSYSCTLRGVDGDKISSIEVFVVGLAYVHLPVQNTAVGGSATLTCNATDVPSSNFIWTRFGQTEKIVNDSQHTMVSVTGSSQLAIKSITVADQGKYVCDASVSLNKTNSASVFLQVLTKPTELEDDDPCNKRHYSVDVGEQLSISCPVSGYPPPFVTWEKNGTQLLKGENVRLCFNSVKDEDFGMYTCTCTDGKTTIGPLTISVKPKSAAKPGTSINETVVKPAKLEWEHQKNAEFYVVKISGEDVRDDYLVGTQTSLEFHFNALVMKKPGERPKETRICANVTAMNEAGVVGKTPTCQYITIKSDTET